MAAEMEAPAFGANFGQKFLNTGKFGKKGKEAIKAAGFDNVAAYKASLGEGKQTKGTLASALQAGPQAQAPVQEAAPAQPSEASQIGTGLVQQGLETRGMGRDLVTNPNEQAQALQGMGQQAFGQSNQFIGDMREQAGFAQDPRLGQRMQDLLQQQEQQARGELNEYFATGDPARRARSQIAQADVDASVTGMGGSLSDNQRQAAVERGLISDRANAQLALGQQLRGTQLGQLDQARGANLNLANMFGQQGQGMAGIGTSAMGTAGQLGLGQIGLGSQMMGQGFDQQVRGVGTGSDLAQRDFENRFNTWMAENNARQQSLANIQGHKGNQLTKRQIRDIQGNNMNNQLF
jgi:hypothetical protein